jgi:hypothetical protein
VLLGHMAFDIILAKAEKTRMAEGEEFNYAIF